MLWDEARIPSTRAMPLETSLLYAILLDHIGKDKAIRMADLYQAWSGDKLSYDARGKWLADVPTLSRHMRKLVDDLRDIYGVPVMSSTQYGYWIAVDESDVNDVCREFRARGLKSLSTAARLKKITLVEEVRQIEMELTK